MDTTQRERFATHHPEASPADIEVQNQVCQEVLVRVVVWKRLPLVQHLAERHLQTCRTALATTVRGIRWRSIACKSRCCRRLSPSASRASLPTHRKLMSTVPCRAPLGLCALKRLTSSGDDKRKGCMRGSAECASTMTRHKPGASSRSSLCQPLLAHRFMTPNNPRVRTVGFSVFGSDAQQQGGGEAEEDPDVFQLDNVVSPGAQMPVIIPPAFQVRVFLPCPSPACGSLRGVLTMRAHFCLFNRKCVRALSSVNCFCLSACRFSK